MNYEDINAAESLALEDSKKTKHLVHVVIYQYMNRTQCDTVKNPYWFKQVSDFKIISVFHNGKKVS